MDTHWSELIQTTEELYTSREVRFHERNKELWLKHIGVKPGMKVLEVGCGGGLFCHRLKQYVPDCLVTGLDFDKGHIAFARKKAEKLGLACDFVEGDIRNLPFEDGTFDLVYSYTVLEHIPHDDFYREQRRVLKSGGRISVLLVRNQLNIPDHTMNEFGAEEEALQKKLWSQVEVDVMTKYHVGMYVQEEHKYPKEMASFGFQDVDVQVFTVMDYAPDNFTVSDEEAVGQINSHRTSSLAGMQKGVRLAPEALMESEKCRLEELIQRRYDRRISDYKEGKKHWDFSTSTVMVISGRK